MATDGPTLPPCDRKIFRKGQAIAEIYSDSGAAVERWVRAVAEKAHARVDWHSFAGYAIVLHLGNQASRARVYAAMAELQHTLKGNITQIF